MPRRFDEGDYAIPTIVGAIGVLLMLLGHALRAVDDNLADLGGAE